MSIPGPDPRHTARDTLMEPLAGLSSTEVAERVAQGRTNASGQHTSRSFGEILRANWS